MHTGVLARACVSTSKGPQPNPQKRQYATSSNKTETERLKQLLEQKDAELRGMQQQLRKLSPAKGPNARANKEPRHSRRHVKAAAPIKPEGPLEDEQPVDQQGPGIQKHTNNQPMGAGVASGAQKA